MSNTRKIKERIINLLYARGDYIRQVNDVEYVTRCPYCGDSIDQNKGHFYIRINPMDNAPIKYNCFKCPAGGYENVSTLEELGIILDSNFKSSIKMMIKKSDDNDIKSSNVYNPKELNFKIPEVSDNDLKLEYVRNRIGYYIPSDDVCRIKLISSLRDFIYLNEIKSVTCKDYFARLLNNEYVGFLTNDNYILFRDITGKNKIRWYKYKILQNYESNKITVHPIASCVNTLTRDDITINICEGSLDILSIYYNLEQNKDNVFNIAMGGKYHISVLNYLIGLGVAGSNVTINVWSDADHRYKPEVKDTRIEHYKNILSKYKYIVGNVNIIYNMKDKDFGIPKSDIEIKKIKI